MQLSIEAAGDWLRIHLDGDPLFDVTDPVRTAGTIALYTGDNTGARFTEVQVDDRRRAAPVAYRFRFTSSAFADFTHHLLGGDDSTRIVAAPAAELTAAAALAVGTAAPGAAGPPDEAEARQFSTVAEAVLGSAARQRVAAPEAFRLVTADNTAALLVRTAEPIDWSRTSIAVSAAGGIPTPRPATATRLIEARFATGTPPDPVTESATVLLLEQHDLGGHALQRRTLPSPAYRPCRTAHRCAGIDFLTDQMMTASAPALLWQPDFTGLAGLTLVVPTGVGVPAWVGNGATLSQDEAFTTPDGAPVGAPIEQPSTGTLAVGAPLAEGDIRLALRLTLLSDSGMAGVVLPLH